MGERERGRGWVSQSGVGNNWCAFSHCLGACCENEYTLNTHTQRGMNICGTSSSSVMCALRCVPQMVATTAWRGNKSIRNCCSMQCRFDSFDHLLSVLPTGFDFHSERAIKCNSNNPAGTLTTLQPYYTTRCCCNWILFAIYFGPTIVLALSSVQ